MSFDFDNKEDFCQAVSGSHILAFPTQHGFVKNMFYKPFPIMSKAKSTLQKLACFKDFWHTSMISGHF